MLRALTILLLVCIPDAPAGEVYRWLDARGGVHYSDHAPAHTDADAIPVPTCDDDACRERRERAYRDAVDLYKEMRAREALSSKRRERRAASSRTEPKGVTPGMSRREVVNVLGKPAIIKLRAGKIHGGALWIYRDGPGTRKILFNRDGVVTRIDD